MKNTQAKTKGKQINRKTKKALTIVISILVVCGLLAAYVATGAVRGGLLSYFQVPQKVLTGLTVTNNEGQETKVTPGQYNYYYTTAYNQIYSTVKMYQQYGLDVSSFGYDVDFSKSLDKQLKETTVDGTEITWGDYLNEQVEDNIKNVVVFYNAAVANHDGEEPELTEEEQSQIDEQIKSYQESAAENGYTIDAYIKAVYGKGVNEELVREEMKKSIIASNYQESLQAQIDALQYTEEEVQAYYDANTALLQAVDAQVFTAKDESTAKSMLEAVNGNNSEQGFADAASGASDTDYYKEAYKDPAKTKEVSLLKAPAQSKLGLSDEGLEWLYSSERTAGDTAIFDKVVLRVIRPAYLSEQPSVTVRHILVTPETEDNAAAVDATTQQWDAAKAKAEELMAQWQADGATEDAFSTLAKENSGDSGSKEDGGLIENAYPGQMVSEFNAWIFGGRNPGDTTIVRTDYGYHLIYFVSVNETPYWKTVAIQNMKDDAMSEKLNGALDQYEVKINWLGSKFFIDDTNLAV